MKKKKGFTLIELLAVIVVLAIIALIATPIVMNTIKSAKKGAAGRSADNYVKQVDLALTEKRVEKNEPINDGTYNINSDGDICLNEACSDKLTIEMSGTKPKGGTIVIKNSQVEKIGTSMSVGDYNLTYNIESNSYVAVEDSGSTLEVLCTKGDGVDLSNLAYGDKFTCELGDNDSKTFYVLEDGDTTILTEGRIAQAGEVSLIMNMNIDSEGKGTTSGNTVAWCSDETLCKTDGIWDSTKGGPITANNYLVTSTVNWKKLNASQISLPSAYQIAKAGGDTVWKDLDWINPELTDSNYTETVLSSWLYENLNGSIVEGYWTSTPFVYEPSNALGVGNEGDIRGFQVNNTVFVNRAGVRPVITISKTQLG